MAPTATPTAQTSPVVSFLTNITIAGVAQNFIDADGQTVVALTVSNAWGFPSSAVTPLGYAVASQRRLTHAGELAVTYTLIAMLQTKIALSLTSYGSTSDLYTNTTTTLTNQVDNGVFTANLQANAQSYGTPDLFSAQSTAVTSSAATVTNPSSSGNNGLEAGATAGIVLCVLFVVFVGGYCAYKHYTGDGAHKSNAAGTKGYVISEDEDNVNNPVHLYAEEEVRDSKKILVNDLNL
jgi:hypothetical protein